MKTKQKQLRKRKNSSINRMKIENAPERSRLIETTWTVAQSALWNNRHFTLIEKEKLKELVKDHFENDKNDKRNFKDLVQRICLAKRYVARKRGRYIAKPSNWLNIHYQFGLVGTKDWLKAVNEQRKTVPDYNSGLTTLANGILKFIESPSIVVFYRYRHMLIAQKQYDLLQVYYNTILNLQYFL